jgi:hypothetical protein
LVSVLVAAGLAVPCLLYRQSEHDWSARSEALQRQARQLAELSAERKRLSNLIAQPGPSALPNEQFRELLRLRGEMGRLRQAARDTEQLRAANQKLLAAPSNFKAPPPGPPDPAKVLAHWPKDQLAYAGYSDPQSALKTFLWAGSRGDVDSLFASMSLPADIIAQARSEQGIAEGRSVAESFAPYTGFYVIGQTTPSPDHTILDVYFEGDGKTRKVALEKIGPEWKLKALEFASGYTSPVGRPEQTEDEVAKGAWP